MINGNMETRPSITSITSITPITTNCRKRGFNEINNSINPSINNINNESHINRGISCIISNDDKDTPPRKRLKTSV